MKDTRPAGPAPGMIYGTALSPTKARITWSTVPAANGYQLYRSGGGSNGMTLIHSIAATPGLVLAVDPTQYGKPVISPTPIKWGGTPNTIPPIRYLDPGRTPRTSYTYMVVASYPDTGQYRSGASEQAVLAMPPGLPPAWITASPSLGTTVTLNWQPAADASGYQVFRGNTPITQQPVRTTSYVDQGLAPGLYRYSVASFYVVEGGAEVQGELSPLPTVEVVLSRCARP